MRKPQDIIQVYIDNIDEIGPEKFNCHGICALGFLLINKKDLEIEEVLFINKAIKLEFKISYEFVWEAGLKEPRLNWLLNKQKEFIENDKS